MASRNGQSNRQGSNNGLLARLLGGESLKKRAQKQRVAEQLERREMMAADISPLTKGIMAPFYMTDQAAYDTLATRIQNRSSGGGSGEAGEGLSNNPLTVTEAEPNNSRLSGQYLPLGTLPNKRDMVNVNGLMSTFFDEDYYTFDLRKGDILDVRLQAAAFNPSGLGVGLYEASGTELFFAIGPTNVRIQRPPGTVPPTKSPLFTDGTTSFSYVIDTDGRYAVRVGDGVGSYVLNLRTYRPPMEQETVGTAQTLFLDFDGATIRSEIINVDLITGVPGTLRVPGIGNYIAALGLEPDDEAALIDEVVKRTTDKLEILIASTANNGYFQRTGRAGDFDITILNSKDHADPFGAANVSRVIIGGTQDEILGDDIGLLGIAQSVDVGNWDREESALVMLDLLIADSFVVPLSGRATQMQLFAELLSMVIAHEAGHFLGGWHQDPSNTIYGVMDQFYDPFVSSGAGRDFIFGTTDDQPLRFLEDEYSPLNPGIPPGGSGVANSDNVLAFGMSTGMKGGNIQGILWHDRNRSGTIDLNEEGISTWTVWADINGNNFLDAGEPRVDTAPDGKYQLGLPVGTHTIYTVPGKNWQPTAPIGGKQTVTVALDQTRTNVNFGFILPPAGATGYKFNDLNANGIKDQGEPPIEGIWIYFDLDGDDRLDLGEPATKTKADGSYNLLPPGPGTYTIREVLDPGFMQTFPIGGEHLVTYDGINPPIGYDFGNRYALDWGDAPAPYPTTSAQSGANAGFLTGLALGSRIDLEDSGQPNPSATGDDIAGATDPVTNLVIDDEDGITFLRPLVAGDANNKLDAFLTNSTGQNAYLHAWLDVNGDGDWNDVGEQLIKNQLLVAGSNVVTFAIPAGAKLGTSYMRFRMAQETNVAVTGRSQTGEVEDYQVLLVDSLNIAVDDAFTVGRNSLNNPLDVLANDFKLPGEVLEIISVSGGSQGGTIRINTAKNGILYSPRNGFVGVETFTYRIRNSLGETDTATVTMTISFSFDKPVAVDDSFDVATNTVSFPLNVLANDVEGKGGALQIVSVSAPNQGGTATIGSGNQSIRYTPRRNFGGTEQFTYTASDASGNLTTATVTVHTLPGARNDDVVGLTFQVTDMAGNAVSAVQQGSQFKVNVFVDDLRAPDQFVVSPGVFAAYLDLLYNSSLVTPAADSSNPLNFKVSFGPSYQLGKRGTNDVPGVINDMGAFTSNPSMDEPNPLLLASITFDALAAGLVDFIGDPADSPPFTDTLLFNTPASAVPTEQIRFGRTTIEVVSNGFEFPFAVDDSLAAPVSVNSFDNVIDVLRNDSTGTTGSIRLINVTQPLNGTASIDDKGTTTPTDDVVLYTPNSGFSGTDQFTYMIQDPRGFSSIARVTLQVGSASADDDVKLRLEVTDLNGVPVDQVTVGSKFQLRGYVQDLRSVGSDLGVFAAFQDILYDSGLVSVNTSGNALGFDVVWSSNYNQVVSGDIRNKNLINEVGSVQNGTASLGNGELLQFTITLTANKAGTAQFIGDPADISPFHDTLLFNPPEVVPFNAIRYIADSVVIVGGAGGGSGEGWTNPNNRFDVNNDGFVSPIDALLVINSLNAGGSRPLGGEGEAGKIYFDVNSDGAISPVDALQVINTLNSGNGEGEAEGEGILAGPSSDSTRTSNVLTIKSSRLAALESADAVVQQLATEVDLAASAPSGGSLSDYLSAADASLAEIGPWLEALDNGLDSNTLNRRRR